MGYRHFCDAGRCRSEAGLDDRATDFLHMPAIDIVVKSMSPDKFFTASQQRRLGELLAKRRIALDTGREMNAAEKTELEALIDAELDGATRRAAGMIGAVMNPIAAPH